VTAGVPPERRCPICGDLNVNPHQDSLCPQHYPGDPPPVTPLEDGPDRPDREPTVAEARAVADAEEQSEDTGLSEREHALLDIHEADRSETTSA
jgi:hypothetical protein